MDEAAWLKLLTEQGPLVAVLVAIIAALYRGKLRAEREFKTLEEINARQSDVMKENTKTTGEAVRALKEAIEAIKFEHRGHDDRR